MQCFQESLSLDLISSILAISSGKYFPNTDLTSPFHPHQQLWTHIQQVEEPQLKDSISFAIVPAKILGSTAIGPSWVRCPFLSQSLQPWVCGVLIG